MLCVLYIMIYIILLIEDYEIKYAVELYFNPKRILINKIMKQREEDIKNLTFY